MTTRDQAAEAAQRLQALRGDLLAEAERQGAALAGIRAARAESVDDEHDPEGPTLSSEWSRVSGLTSGLASELAAVDAAIERLRAGTYGVCVRCVNEISADRREARPATELCIQCARARDAR